MNDILSSFWTRINFCDVGFQDIGFTFLCNDCLAQHMFIFHSPHNAHPTKFRRIVINDDINRSIALT